MEQQQQNLFHSSASGGAESAAPVMATTSGGGNSRDLYLKHLNKISHKISKPIRRTPSFDRTQIESLQAVPEPMLNQPPPPPPPHQHQPPVYNINKNDFRDVVQRLTGSPAHERFSTPPPIQPPKPQSSRLQRIRPPPLAQISNRPPQQMGPPAGFLPGQRQPLSPLPPFPAVHAAAESPISAYMRFLQTPPDFSASPRWNGLPPPPQMMPNFPLLPLPQLQFPPLPQPFGCIPSPRSPYGGGMSQGMMFPPSQLPLSPTPPVPSPRWKGT